MTVYYILFGLEALLGLLITIKRKKTPIYVINDMGSVKYTLNEKVFLCISFCTITIVSGLRAASVGVDTINYINDYFFDVIEQGIFSGKNLEIVLRAIAWVCSLVSKKYQLFLFTTSALINFLFLKFINENSKYVALGVVIFIGMFFIPSLNLIREWLAIGLGLNSYSCFKRKKYILATCLIVLAVLTHMTALCLLVIPLVSLINNKKRTFFIVTVGCIVFYLFRNYFLQFIVMLIPKYTDYITKDYFAGSGSFNIKDLIYIAVLLCFLFCIFFKKNFFNKHELSELYECSLFLVVAITFSLCGGDFFILHRIVFYYSSFLMMAIPNFVSKFKGYKLISIIVIVAIFAVLYRNSYNDNNGIAQYMFFWQA